MASQSCCCCLSLRAGAIIIAALSLIGGAFSIALAIILQKYDFCEMIEESEQSSSQYVRLLVRYDEFNSHSDYTECIKYVRPVFVTWLSVSSFYSLSALFYIIGGFTRKPWMMYSFVVLRAITTALLVGLAVLSIVAAFSVSDVDGSSTVAYVLATNFLVTACISIYFVHITLVFIKQIRRDNGARSAIRAAEAARNNAAQRMAMSLQAQPQPQGMYPRSPGASYQNLAFQRPPLSTVPVYTNMTAPSAPQHNAYNSEHNFYYGPPPQYASAGPPLPANNRPLGSWSQFN